MDTKTSKKTYYFSHDYNARNSEKILMLRATHGLEGYGAYWALAEMMYESTSGKLCYDKLAGMAFGLGIDEKVLKEVVDTCVKEGLFNKEDNFIWSEDVEERKEKIDKLRKVRAEVGRLGGLASNRSAIGKQLVSKIKQRKGKERKGNKSIEENTSFNDFWELYPTRKGTKVGKKQCQEYWKKIQAEDIPAIMTGVKNYADSQVAKDGYAKDPIRFLKHEIWRDFQEVVKKETPRWQK